MTFLASSSSSSSTITDVEPGLLGFLVVAALGVALVFLLRSMNKQFKKIGPRPEDPESVATDEANTDEANEVAVGTVGPPNPASGSVPADEEAAVWDTGADFVPDTGPKSGRGGRS